MVENTYGIPFFLIEFQTYEDARSGEWTRLPTYRLVQPTPRAETNPDGYHWQGEVFVDGERLNLRTNRGREGTSGAGGDG